MKMKKMKFVLTSVLLCSVLFSLFTIAVFAEENDEVGFTVSANLPSNQMDTNVSYFDLRMEPDTEQILEVNVHNRSSEEIRVEVAAITASTNRNGIIDYKTANIKDETMDIVFSDIAVPVENVLVIPAYSSEVAKIKVTMPEEEYDGVLLGGILVRKISLEQEKEETNSSKEVSTAVENRYNYVIGVKLTETEMEIFPDFEMVSAAPVLVNYHQAIETNIRNTQAFIVKGMSGNVKIYAENSDIVLLENSMDSIDMAPNSVFPFSVNLGDVKLKPGKYVSKVHLELEEETWDLEQTFVITANEMKELAQESVDTNYSAIPLWAIILIVLAVVVLALMIIILILLLKKRNEGEAREKK